MSKPIYNQVEWYCLHRGGIRPEVFVNVYNLQAKILLRKNGEYVDVTDSIPNGREMASEATYASGGGVNVSGWYPPTEEIIGALIEEGIIKGGV